MISLVTWRVSIEILYCMSTLYSSHWRINPSIIYIYRVPLYLLNHPTEMSLLVSSCKVAMSHNDSWTYWGKGMSDSTSHDYDEKQKEPMAFLAISHSSCSPHTFITNPLEHTERAHELRTATRVHKERDGNLRTRRNIQHRIPIKDWTYLANLTSIDNPNKTNWEFTMIQSAFCWNQ